MRLIDHWIGGAARPGHGTRRSPVFDPSTGEVQAEVLLADERDVDGVVAVARKAFSSWSETSLTARTEVMFAFRQLVAAHRNELARMITAEHGKVVSDAAGEVQRGLEVVEYACGIPSLLTGDFSDQVSSDVDLHSFRQPLGVVVGITPFNFPAMVPMWMFPLAIACGNAFVLKPSERDPSVSLRLAELLTEAGLPDGVFNVLQGDRTAVEALVSHPGVDAVSFVGSTSIARQVHHRATQAGKRVQALGGAKNHAVVLPDADLDLAADHLASAAFGSAGQRCMAVSAAVAVGPGADALVERLAERSQAVVVGPGDDPASEMGPVITAAARTRILGLVDDSARQGTRVVTDRAVRVGSRHRDGFFVAPTVIDGVTEDMDVYRTEVFGPVLSVLRRDSLQAAIEVVNRSPFGNGAAIFTDDGGSARTFVRQVQAGMVGVNVPVPVPMAYHSFGGWKASMFGDHDVYGRDGVAFYTRGKAVTTRWPSASALAPSTLDMPTAT